MASNVGVTNDDSEDSFVVLNRSLGPETLEMINSNASSAPGQSSSMSSNVTGFPSIPQLLEQTPNTISISQAANAMAVSATSDLNAEEIQLKLERLLQENLQLKETLYQNNLAMKKQFNTLVMWQEDVMKVHQSHKEKFEETKKFITNLRAENQELKKAASLPPLIKTEANEESILNLKSKISTLEFELDTLRQANIKYKSEHIKIVHDLENKLIETEQIKQQDIAVLKKENEYLNQQLDAVRKQLMNTEEKLNNINSKIPNDVKIEDVQTMREQLKMLANEIVMKNNILKEKEDVVDKLHEEMDKLKIENETVLILRAQVDVYQNDFKQERDSRNQIKEEKDRLADELSHLQRRNAELLHEIEQFQQHANVNQQFAYSHQHQQSSPARERSPSAVTYSCPVCQRRFASQILVQEHIEFCLANAS